MKPVTPARLVQVADVGLHRADRAKLVARRLLPERARQRFELDWIAEWRGGAVGLDIADRIGRHPATAWAS